MGARNLNCARILLLLPNLSTWRNFSEEVAWAATISGAAVPDMVAWKVRGWAWPSWIYFDREVVREVVGSDLYEVSPNDLNLLLQQQGFIHLGFPSAPFSVSLRILLVLRYSAYSILVWKFIQRNLAYFVLIQVIQRDLLRKKHNKIELVSLKYTFVCACNASPQTRFGAHFPQLILRNALYQYTICAIPRNKLPANMQDAEFRNN